ncbi:DUF2490 domain-containing protein [Flavobacterium luteum]|uniref:DUF2490 domain-containing protein n=1 Tax=Flavobacterium luteum TaxID=2026654 RepID=A0A7J5AFC8_9FLAO|nr:DUF2490 domain-containing protein [Flavobacterium luteum]KAB1156272.1 DUF2490 domain-containing protein [Flavobacterium luteum]
MKTLIIIFAFFSFLGVCAQNTRITDNNSIGWYTFNGTFKLNQKFGIHSEYQWRRDKLTTNWQQSLLRLGINYQLNPKIQLRLGYAWIETFPYGDIPINVFGKDFTEHRSFQMAAITDKISIVELSHRFMLEQRWVGRYTNTSLNTEDDYLYMNRFRYMFRVQVPLRGKAMSDKTPYFAIYDEIFIGFGKNVNENVFDQNRLGLIFGYRFNKALRIEAGYLNQILQLGREEKGRNVFQNNNGIIVNTAFNFDLGKK